MNSLNVRLYRDDGDIDVTVEFDYYGACRGSLDSAGLQIEPDEPEGIDILGVQDQDGRKITPSLEEMSIIMDVIRKRAKQSV
jgi:hypothetical protein